MGFQDRCFPVKLNNNYFEEHQQKTASETATIKSSERCCMVAMKKNDNIIDLLSLKRLIAFEGRYHTKNLRIAILKLKLFQNKVHLLGQSYVIC